MLFAIIIIGVGVILLAGIFPVAIGQAQANLNDSIAVGVARDALKYVESAVNNYTGQASLLPVTSSVGSTPQLLPLPFSLVSSGNQTLSTDRRYGWIGFYRRDFVGTNVNIAGTVQTLYTPAPYAQVWIITAQATAEGQPAFAGQFYQPVAQPGPPALGNVQIYQPPNGTQPTNLVCALPTYNTYGSTITLEDYYYYKPATGAYFDSGVSYVHAAGGPVDNNAYALVLTTSGSTLRMTQGGDANLIGQVLRLGANANAIVNGSYTYMWDLLPGSDINPNDNQFLRNGTVPVPSGTAMNNGSLVLFVLGKPLIPNTSASNPMPAYTYQGPVQDVTCVSGFVRVSN